MHIAIFGAKFTVLTAIIVALPSVPVLRTAVAAVSFFLAAFVIRGFAGFGFVAVRFGHFDLAVITGVVVHAAIPVFITVETAGIMLFLPRLLPAAEIGEDAEIMIGKLQIIFGVHPIIIMLGVAGQFLVFFEHLGGIAPGPVINPVLIVKAVAIVILRPVIIIPTATAACLAVIVH